MGNCHTFNLIGLTNEIVLLHCSNVNRNFHYVFKYIIDYLMLSANIMSVLVKCHIFGYNRVYVSTVVGL